MHRAFSTQFSTILQLYKVANSFGVLFNGLLAELPATLDSFLPVPQVIIYGWLAGSHEVAGKNTCQVV